MTSPPQVLAPEELQHLSELREVLRTTATPGWLIIIRRMQEDADEAHEELLGAAYATDSALAGLARRWQQRESVVRSLKQYIQSCEEQKKMLLESTEQERSSEYAEPDRETA